MMYMVTMLDEARNDLRVVDRLNASSEEEAEKIARGLAPGLAVLFVHRIGNPEAIDRHPLRVRKPVQQEMF